MKKTRTRLQNLNIPISLPTPQQNLQQISQLQEQNYTDDSPYLRQFNINGWAAKDVFIQKYNNQKTIYDIMNSPLISRRSVLVSRQMLKSVHQNKKLNDKSKDNIDDIKKFRLHSAQLTPRVHYPIETNLQRSSRIQVLEKPIIKQRSKTSHKFLRKKSGQRLTSNKLPQNSVAKHSIELVNYPILTTYQRQQDPQKAFTASIGKIRSLIKQRRW